MQIDCQSVGNRNLLLLSLKNKRTEIPKNSRWKIYIYIKSNILNLIWLS